MGLAHGPEEIAKYLHLDKISIWRLWYRSPEKKRNAILAHISEHILECAYVHKNAQPYT